MPEGNAHQVEFTGDDKCIVGADEDFEPYALTARNLTDDTELPASRGSNTTRLEEGQTITGDSVFAGPAQLPVVLGAKGNRLTFSLPSTARRA